MHTASPLPINAEQLLLEADPWDDAEQMHDLGVTEFLCGASGHKAPARFCNVPETGRRILSTVRALDSGPQIAVGG